MAKKPTVAEMISPITTDNLMDKMAKHQPAWLLAWADMDDLKTVIEYQKRGMDWESLLRSRMQDKVHLVAHAFASLMLEQEEEDKDGNM